MLSIGFSRQLARSGFQRRALPVQAGMVIYRLADRSGHVAVPIDEWEGLGEQFAARVDPVVRAAHWLMGAIVPAVIVTALLCVATPLGGAGGGLLIVLLLWFGPVAIYLWQSHRVQRAARDIEAQLRKYPRAPAPRTRRSGPPRWLEIALMLLVGPALLLQIYGTLNPAAYAGTRWSGMGLDWTGIAGLACLALYYGIRWRARRAHAAYLRELERRGRNVDFRSRARAEKASASRST